jgi:hypothetical protein
VIRDAGGRSQVTLGFAASAAAGRPVVAAAGRFLAPANRYFPRMHSPVAPDELAAAIRAEVAAGAAWVKIIGDFPQWAEDGPVPQSTAATYDLETLRCAIDAAHAAGARVAVHSNLPDSGLAGMGADSIEHGTALGHSELEALGVRAGAWMPTLCAVLHGRDSSDPAVRSRTGELRERFRDCLPYAVAHGVRVLAGTDVVGTAAAEIALLAEHGLTAAQAIAAAGSAARDFLGIHPEGDIVTYDDDPLEDPGVLARPAAVVVRGVRVRLRLLVSLAPLGDGCLVGAGGGDDELDDRIEGHRGGVDHQVVQGRVGRVAPVQPADVGVAGLVGRAQAVPRMLLSDALDHSALGGAAGGRAVEPDVEAAVLAEHDRRRPAQDHAAPAGQQALDPGLAVAAQVLVLVVGGWRRLGRPGRHRLGEMGQQPVHRGDLDLFLRQLLIARPGLGDVALGRGDPLQEGQGEPFGQGRGDDAAAGAVGR